jgi:glycosyltransferase involved in cell wall biosynthesis
MPEISVVVPTRDRADMSRQAITSVLRQDVDLEVIVVDEGSSDDTVSMLERWGDPRVRVVRHDTPKGVSRARNAGADHARAPVLAFLDDDDLWLAGKLRSHLTEMGRTGASWCYSGALLFSAGPLLEAVLPAPAPRAVVDRIAYANVVPGGGSNVVVTRAALDAVGGFDAAVPVVADWDMWVRLAEHGSPAAVDAPLVAYRRHDRNMSRHHIDSLLRAVRELDVRYRDRRGGEPLDWPDLHRWVCHDALRTGDRRTALRMGFGSVRAGHPGGVELAVRSALPFRRRPPVESLEDVTGPLDRIRPPRVVTWPSGTRDELVELLGVV